jgi:lysophospholipase L1-like esterase
MGRSLLMERSAFLLGMATVAAGPAYVPVGGKGALRIAVLGDSLALGTGASRADGGFIFRAFRSVLAQHPGSRIDNVAIGGATVADVVRLQVDRLRGTRYTCAIVCAGGNDVVRATREAAFASAYATLLARLARTLPGTRIICCGVPDVSESPIFADERAETLATARRDNEAVRTAARAAGAAFVDLFALTHGLHDPQRFLSRDRFHPSDTGYALLANALTPVLAGVTKPATRQALTKPNTIRM